jgi:peroxiredoxin
MDVVLLIVRVGLAAVFLVAGLGKLADTAGSRRAVADFGVPPWLAAPVGTLLPLMELAVAVALLPVDSAWWGALGGLVLLGAFITGISVNLARGKTPDCHCFGQIHSAPAGRSTLVRNGLLAAAATLVVVQGQNDVGPSATGWIGDVTAAQWAGGIGALVVVGLLAAALSFQLQLLRQHGRVLLRVEALENLLAERGIALPPAEEPVPAGMAAMGLPVAAPAPDFELEQLDGGKASLESMQGEGKPVLLIFTDPDCGPCTALLPDVSRWQREHSETFKTVVVSRGTAKANRAKSSEQGITNVLLQKDREVAEAYRSPATPTGVLVSPDRTIATPLAAGPDAIRALVARAASGEAPSSFPEPVVVPAGGNGHGASVAPIKPVGPKRGEPAPPFQLPDLQDRRVDVADLRGNETMVLFWNPGCGFCQQMLGDLKEWESKPPRGAPKLVLVSTGDVETNKAMGLRSPVLLDQGFATGRKYGAGGTPSAVLIDAAGKIASEVAVGAEESLALAGYEPAKRATP